MVRGRFTGIVIAGLIILCGCVATDVGPINTISRNSPPPTPRYIPDPGDDKSTVMALAFSGGGMRAAAFAYGALTAFDDMVVDEEPYRRTMVDNIRMISGVSGGAVVAAYFAHKGKDEYRDLDRRFLYRNPESSMRTNMISPVTLSRALSGGVNDRSAFAHWLDSNLFDQADFASFRRPDNPTIWINASDIYNRTPFLFTYDTFAALCSDLDRVRIADAVAASASFPVVFAPIVVQTNRTQCGYARPDWLTEALSDRQGSIRLQAYAAALDAYSQNDDLNYVRLMDGGLTDNLGITGFVLERAAADTPHGPLSAEEAVLLRHFIFVIVDAGRGQTETWGAAPGNLPIAKALSAAIDTSMSASLRDEVDALQLAVSAWRNELVEYRCGLPIATIRRIRGTASGWNCRDVEFDVEHLSFADLGDDRALEMSMVPTRLSLPSSQVEMVIAAGRDVVSGNERLRSAIDNIRRRAGVGTQLVFSE